MALNRTADPRTLRGMRHAFLIAVTLACTTLTAQRRQRDNQREFKLDHFTHKVVTFDAPSIDRGEARYVIYMPKDYDDEKQSKTKYPLAIWLHGMNGGYHRFHDNDGPQILDELREKDEIPPMLFVAANANRRPLYMNGMNGGDYEDLIVKDLLSHLEKTYRVADEREKRAILGVSIGGLGAMKIALANTDKFGSVATHSAVVLPESLDGLPRRMARRIEWIAESNGLDQVLGNPIDAKKWKTVSTIAITKEMKLDELKKLRIYFDAGTDDRYDLAPGNQQLSKALKERGVDHAFELVDGGGHAWGSGATQRQLPKSLKFVAATFRGQQGKPASKPTSRPHKAGRPQAGKK